MRSVGRIDLNLYVLKALFESSVFSRISYWLDNQQPDEVNYSDLKPFLLKKFTLTESERDPENLDLLNQYNGDRSPREI